MADTPDMDKSRVGVDAVLKSMHAIRQSIGDLNYLWARLRDFEKTHTAVAWIIAGFLTSSPRHWLSESRRLTSHSILHLEFQELRLGGQMQLRQNQLDKEKILINASLYDTSAGPNISCSSQQEPRAT